MRDAANIRSVAELKPDYMGFIFYNGSPRFAGDLSPVVTDGLSAEINKTAVFVDESLQTVIDVLDQYNFDFVQLHGSESPQFCKQLRDHALVIKAFGVDENFDFGQLKKYKNKADMFLFDTKTSQHGGSGQSFNWELLDKYDLEIPFFLSGGLSRENLGEVTGIIHPMLYGVDLNSRFEVSPGIKDIEKLNKAFSIIKQDI